jgi:hypothetical protein
MAEKPSAPQGPRDFENFDDYRKNWIIPNLLVDLDTVFLRTRKRAAELKRTTVGGGTFVLGMALFAAFDHLGSFLARWDDEPERRESLKQTDNIARTARSLTSTADVCALVANLGRNSLVHSFWPQTAMPMDGWALGYSLGGDVDEEHDLLYVTVHSIDPKRRHSKPKKVLKFAQNVYVLYKELAVAVREGTAFRDVHPKAFERVQKYSTKVGLPGERARAALDDLIDGGVPTLTRGMTREEAWKLKKVAEGKKIWNDPQLVYYRRTGEVRRIPAT